MTNYIVHFEDGSDAYLSHHGKIGMHWGEWNDETRKRYMEHPDLIGEYAKALNTHAYNQSFQDGKKLNPVEAGVKNLGAVASNVLKDVNYNFVEPMGRTVQGIARDTILVGKAVVDVLFGTHELDKVPESTWVERKWDEEWKKAKRSGADEKTARQRATNYTDWYFFSGTPESRR